MISEPTSTKLDYMLKRLGLFKQTCAWMTGDEDGRFSEATFFERAAFFAPICLTHQETR